MGSAVPRVLGREDICPAARAGLVGHCSRTVPAPSPPRVRGTGWQPLLRHVQLDTCRLSPGQSGRGWPAGLVSDLLAGWSAGLRGNRTPHLGRVLCAVWKSGWESFPQSPRFLAIPLLCGLGQVSGFAEPPALPAGTAGRAARSHGLPECEAHEQGGLALSTRAGSVWGTADSTEWLLLEKTVRSGWVSVFCWEAQHGEPEPRAARLLDAVSAEGSPALGQQTQPGDRVLLEQHVKTVWTPL